MELFFFSAFVRLFKYTALSNAYRLVDTYQNYCCCFDLRELLSLVCINARLRLEKTQLGWHSHVPNATPALHLILTFSWRKNSAYWLHTGTTTLSFLHPLYVTFFLHRYIHTHINISPNICMYISTHSQITHTIEIIFCSRATYTNHACTWG